MACEEFVQLVTRYLERAFSQTELEKLGTFFTRFAPLRRTLIEDAIQQATRVKGKALHVRYYLQHIEQVMRSRGR